MLVSVARLLERGRKSPSAAAPMTEQPFLGSTLLTPYEEGARKGALKIACLKSPDWITAFRRITTCGRKHKIMMNFGAWNVRTLMDSATSDRPERRTAIIARELRRCRIDLAALSETRRADEGQLKEEKGGYTFFWKGKAADEPRIHGVGFAIRNYLISHLSELPVGINERLMTIRLMLDNNQMATVVSAYAPTLDSEEEVKETFYTCLDETLSRIPREDKIILLGDFNARVGRDQDLWKGTIGKEGIGNINSNGVLLLSICARFNLTITNTLFCQKTNLRHPGDTLAPNSGISLTMSLYAPGTVVT